MTNITLESKVKCGQICKDLIEIAHFCIMISVGVFVSVHQYDLDDKCQIY